MKWAGVFAWTPVSISRLGFCLLLVGLPGCVSAPSLQSGGFKGLGEYQALSDEESPGAGSPAPLRGSETSPLMLRGIPNRTDVEQGPSDFSFDWPVDSARLTRGFSIGGRRPHWGIDLAAPRGTPIYAAERGVVVYTGRGFKGYGKLVVIEHGDRWATLYSHLHTIDTKEGEQVRQGQVIGTMGRTGRATGVHLHFEIRYNRQPVNPLMYLPQGYSSSTDTARK